MCAVIALLGMRVQMMALAEALGLELSLLVVEKLESSIELMMNTMG